MAENSHISWTTHTFNPWVGCTKVSTGRCGACEHCYAENLMDTRLGRVEFGAPGKGVGTRERTSAANWRKPLTWNRQAGMTGKHPFVFCASLADVFDNAVPVEWRRDLLKLIWATPNLRWLLLTKRPQNITRLFRQAMRANIGPEPTRWPPNAAIGCTVVTQEEADRDVPHLLRAKAELDPAFAFLSMEPLMGPVRLMWAWLDEGPKYGFPGLDWVITGGESDQGGRNARPSHPDWFRNLRDQCAAAGVPYHHKQNGEWQGYGSAAPTDADGNLGLPCEPSAHFDFPDGERVFRVGKKFAGRLLDGVEHNGFPS